MSASVGDEHNGCELPWTTRFREGEPGELPILELLLNLKAANAPAATSWL